MNVLFLSVSTGGGHFKAAEAIKHTVELKYPRSNNLIIDSLKYINPMVDKLVVGGYLNTVRVSPQIYGKLYRLSEYNSNINYFGKAINNLLSSRLRTLVEDRRPSIAVCTHPFPLQMLSALKKKYAFSLPLIGVITDFTTHSLWVQEGVEAFIVAHDTLKMHMIARGIPEKCIYSYGIPVGENFRLKKTRSTLLGELGLENKTTVLVMGGSLGLGEISGAFLALLRSALDVQIVVITGQNTRMKAELECISAGSRKPVKILSYTNRVSDYMDVSDLIITKPGGITTSEVLIKQLPMLIMSPIPGQEEENAQFLCREGAAMRINSMSGLESQLQHLFNSPHKLAEMKKAAGALAKPDASSRIVNLMESLVHC